MFAMSIRHVVFRGHDKSRCAALLKTTTGKVHGARPVTAFLYGFFFFRGIVEAATILSASFNSSRDSLSGCWCVWWSEFRNARHQPLCADTKSEKKKGAITRLYEVYSREASHPNFSFVFWKVHSCMLGVTAISTNFLRNYLLARSRLPLVAALIWK